MADIGSTLRETRMRERIDITTVESATKIRAKYLRALENEEWDLLPGPTFVRTFLRTYGDYLGLDSKMLVEEYKQRFERPGPQDMLPFSSRTTGGGRRPQRAPRGVPPWAIVGGCVALLVAALFVLGSFGGDDGSPSGVAKATPTATATSKPAKQKSKKKQAPAVPKVVSLKILPEAEVNVCLIDASGTPLIRSQNLTQPTDAYRSRSMKVTFGNGLVSMKINGKSFPVPDTDAAIGYELRPGKDPKELAAADQPTCT
jgi:cytoskeletal protein RodZ